MPVPIFVPAMFSVIAMFFTTISRCVDRLRIRLAPHCGTGRAAKRSAQNRAVLTAQIISNRRAGCAAQRTAKHCAAIGGIGIYTGTEKQGDC